MLELKGYQKQHLRALAHHLDPVVRIGKKGIVPAVMRALNEALETHELVKVRFQDIEDKAQMKALTQDLEKQSRACLAGSVGRTIILYRQNADPQKRKIALPSKKKTVTPAD